MPDGWPATETAENDIGLPKHLRKGVGVLVETLVKFKDSENALLHALAVILDTDVDKREAVRVVHFKRSIVLYHLESISPFPTRHKNNGIITTLFQVFRKPKMAVKRTMRKER